MIYDDSILEAQNRIILVGLKFSILVAQSAIMLDHQKLVMMMKNN